MPRERTILPELLIVAAFSRHPAALAWARQRLEAHFGSIAFASEAFRVDEHTTYYRESMGADLQKVLLVFENLVLPETLVDIKRQTNEWEGALAATAQYAEARPLNLDPGLLSLGKFVLATTKDQGHRIYLHDGIFAEVTLRFQDGEFQPWPWTYRDYRQDTVLAFLRRARDYYRERLAEGDSSNRR